MAVSNRESEHGEGYIRLYRKLLSSAIFQNRKLFQVWMWCLMRANWREAVCVFEGNELRLKRGQFITGRYTGSVECLMKPKTFYNQLVKLSEFGNLVLKSDNRKTLVTVVNYEDYQTDTVVVGHLLDTCWTPVGHPLDTDKEVKNIISQEQDCVGQTDFDIIWKRYPNRQQRKNAERHFKATVKTSADLRDLNVALDNYLRSGNVSRGYIKQGSTWFNDWREWVNPTEVMMKGNSNGTQAHTGITSENLRRSLQMAEQLADARKARGEQ